MDTSYSLNPGSLDYLTTNISHRGENPAQVPLNLDVEEDDVRAIETHTSIEDNNNITTSPYEETGPDSMAIDMENQTMSLSFLDEHWRTNPEGKKIIFKVLQLYGFFIVIYVLSML